MNKNAIDEAVGHPLLADPSATAGIFVTQDSGPLVVPLDYRYDSAIVPHRAAALLAINFRFRADRLSARALQPLDAPSFDSATAAGFFSRSACSPEAGFPPTSRR
jgi:hypothetical protein